MITRQRNRDLESGFEACRESPKYGVMAGWALAVILPIGLTGVVRANTFYNYSGNLFTDFTGVAGCSQPSTGQSITDICQITGFFEVTQPLVANLFDAPITPTDWQFTNGFDSWDPGGTVLFPPSSSTFLISTDSSGNISDWSISLVLSGTNPQNITEDIILFTNNGEDFTESKLVGVGVFDQAENAGMPGTWTMETIGGTGGGGDGGGGGGTSIPEPASAMLVGSAILGCVHLGRRKR